MSNTSTDFPCSKCEKSFDTAQGRALHIRRAHGDLRGSTWTKKRRMKTKRKYTKRKPMAHAHTNGVHHGGTIPGTTSLADVTAQCKQEADIIAALTFLKQFGTVDFRRHQ